MAARVGVIFHGLGTPGRILEDGEAPYWLSTDRFEMIMDRIAGLPDPSLVRISFDDGNASDMEIAVPRLLDRGLTADVFALTGRLDQAGSLSSSDLRALVSMGMSVGSHGIHHRNLRRVSPKELTNELRRSKAQLEAVLGRTVTDFSIPFGSYNARVLAAIRASGYQVAWSSDRGRMSDQAFLRPRTSVRADTDDAAVARILNGEMPLAEAARRRLGMLSRRLSRR
jgi:peptidoglycan/xylan/chitin deacetylase (PgdA/CDA1 family)